MGQRREARELALKCLHQWDQQPKEGEKLAEHLIERQASSAEEAAYCRRLLRAYWSDAAAIDEVIERATEKWKLSRLAVVDRAVLRLAATELLHFGDVPARVSLDEAIELAKRYSTEKSGAFVNGILDRILTELEKQHGHR